MKIPQAVYAVIFGLFAGAFFAEAIKLGGEPYCTGSNGAFIVPAGEDECIVKSSGGKAATVALGGLAGVAGILSALAALLFTVTGRHWRWIFIALIVAIVSYGLAAAVGVGVAKSSGFRPSQPVQ